MISVWWFLAAITLGTLGVVWVVLSARHAVERIQEAYHQALADEIALVGALEVERDEATAKVADLLAENGRLHSHINGMVQIAGKQYLSRMLLEHAVEPEWMVKEAERAIRDRVAKHVAGLVRITREDDLPRSEIVFTGSIWMRDVLDTLATVEGIMDGTTAAGEEV